MARRILIVDDELDILSAWSKVLRRRNHMVRTASSYNEALRECEQHAFDIVILDYVMPGMKGVELLCRIRKQLPLVRSIMISGKLDEDMEETRIRDSIREAVETDIYLHKPVENEQLVEAVSSLIRDHGEQDWVDVSRRIGKVDEATIKKAKVVQKGLKKYLKKRK